MACSITLRGLAQDCSSNVGGVKNVYISQWDSSAITFASSASTKVSVATSGTTWSFKHYYFRKGAASFSSEGTFDAANGTKFLTNTLTMNFARMDTDKRIELSVLILGDLLAVVEDGNGKMWIMGAEEPVNATGAQAATGQAKTDANQYSITLEDSTSSFAYELDDTSVAAFKALENTSAT